MASSRLPAPPALPGFMRICELGTNSGQNGVVFKELDTTANQHVAIKYMLRSELNADGVKRELRNHALAAHPHIASLRRAVLLPEWLVVVVELCQGDMNLLDWLNTQPGYRASENIARGIVKQLLDAMQQLHANELYHRDLKARAVCRMQPRVPVGNSRPLCRAVVGLRMRAVD
jgi:serine/threonine protein kinase